MPYSPTKTVAAIAALLRSGEATDITMKGKNERYEEVFGQEIITCLGVE
jgi:hypothetical protein